MSIKGLEREIQRIATEENIDLSKVNIKNVVNYIKTHINKAA